MIESVTVMSDPGLSRGDTAVKNGVAASYVVPAACAAVTPKVVLIEITFEAVSNAKLFGAMTWLFTIWNVLCPISAMKASLYLLPTYSGNSSEKNTKSKATQVAPAGG